PEGAAFASRIVVPPSWPVCFVADLLPPQPAATTTAIAVAATATSPDRFRTSASSALARVIGADPTPLLVDDQHDLAKAVGRVEAPVRVRRTFEREDTVDHGAPGRAVDVLEQRVELARAPHRRSLDPEVAEVEA